MKHRFAITLATFGAVALAVSSAGPPTITGGVPTQRVWGDGTEWVVLFLQHTVAGGARWQPFYLIAPVDATNPQSVGRWGFGPHDDVMGVRSHTNRAPVGPCKLLIVVAGPNGIPGANIEVVPDANLGVMIVRAVDLPGSSGMTPLTSAGLITRAADAGLVSLFEPHPGGASVTFMCPVHPMQG